MAHWNFRTALHYRVKDGVREIEDYMTVHEVYYDDASRPEGFIASEAVARTKDEALRLAAAFDKKPALWFNDDTMEYDEYHRIDYKEWGWVDNGII